MRGKSCFFVGHREAMEELYPVLQDAVERHITEYGVTEFIVGHYGGFDRLASQAVIEAKRIHPGVTLTMLLPYHPADHPVILPADFDSTFYPPGMEAVPRRVAIVRANEYMIDHVDYLIAYVCHPGSNAAMLMAKAKRKHGDKSITLLKNKD